MEQWDHPDNSMEKRPSPSDPQCSLGWCHPFRREQLKHSSSHHTQASAWSPLLCPYHHGKGRTPQKAKQNTPSQSKSILPLLEIILPGFCHSTTMSTISNQGTAIVAANEWHCPLDSFSVQHVVFILCLLSGFHSLSFIWPPEDNKIIQNLKLTNLRFLVSINVHIHKADDSTKYKISKTRPILSCLACIC